MPPNYRQQQGQPLTSNERRGTVVLGVVVLLAALGLGIWALAGLGGAKSPKGPCVSAVIASSTGGGTTRFCGADARSWCASETQGTGPVAVQAQRACRRADLLPAGTGSS
ncbi:MAG TPA: hypothetical protein VMF65_21655 [Acidimicrobiales bacterium]|nr:hypothetical protein [Acidimicrobiales bacterium]